MKIFKILSIIIKKRFPVRERFLFFERLYPSFLQIKNPVLVLSNFQDDIKQKLNKKKKDRSMMIIYEI